MGGARRRPCCFGPMRPLTNIWESDHGEARNDQDPAELDRRHRLLLRDQEEPAQHHREDVVPQVRPGGEEARRVQGRQDQVSMNAGNLPGSQPVQCPVPSSGSMTILPIFTRIPLRAAIAGALALAVPAALAVSATPAAAQADQLDQAVTALRSITTLRADFNQADRNGQVVRGVLTFKSPGRIRFEYERSVNMLIVSNGRSLTLIDYDVAQLERWPISDSPLGALLDPRRDVKRYGKLLPTSNPNVISIEVKDPKKPEYGVITLIFVRDAAAPGGLELNSWVQLDAQNKRTTVRLSNQRYGIAVPDSAFTYRDPRRTAGRP